LEMVSDQSKTWQVLLIAAAIVFATWGAIIVGSQNEPPGPPVPEKASLIYSINGENEGVSYNGSLSIEYEIRGPGTLAYFKNWTEGDPGPDGVPHFQFLSGTGHRLDEMIIETPWGPKAIYRSLEGAYINGDGGMFIYYIGLESGLTYRVDLVMNDYRTTIQLTGTNFTEVSEMDLLTVEEVSEVVSGNWSDGILYGFGGGEVAYGINGPSEEDGDIIRVNSSDYALYLINENLVWDMVDGGYFIYDSQMALIGTGSAEFLLDDGWYFTLIVPSNGPGGQLTIKGEHLEEP
jgi:hypothetical protein